MLEVSIIICLAAILFFSLKNFSKTAPIVSGDISDNEVGLIMEKKENFFKKLFAKKPIDVDQIIEEIDKDKEKVVSPSEINQARKAYREEDPEIARMLFEAEKSFASNDLRQAEDFVLDVLTREKKCSQAYTIMGKIAYHRGSFDDAKESFNAAIKCDPDSSEAHFGLGQILMRDENYSDALVSFQAAISLDRGVAEWYAELGKAYILVRQFAKATKALKRAASLDLDNKEYRNLASEAEDKQRAHSKVFGGRR